MWRSKEWDGSSKAFLKLQQKCDVEQKNDVKPKKKLVEKPNQTKKNLLRSKKNLFTQRISTDVTHT